MSNLNNFQNSELPCDLKHNLSLNQNPTTKEDFGHLNLLSFELLQKIKTQDTSVICEITSDHDLQGTTRDIQSNSILYFNGGSFSNGTINLLGKCLLLTNRNEIFNDIIIQASNHSCYFLSKGSDEMFSGEDELGILRNLNYFEGIELSKDYEIEPEFNDFVFNIYDRSFYINGNGHQIILTGDGGSFVNFNSDYEDNRGKNLTISKLLVSFAGEIVEHISPAYCYYSLIAMPYCSNLVLDNTELTTTGICITNYHSEEFQYRKNTIVIKNRSVLKSDYFIIEDGAEFIYIDDSTLSAYSTYHFLNDLISNGYPNSVVNIQLTNSTFIGGIEIMQGNVFVSNCILFERFNVGIRTDDILTVNNVKNINVTVVNSVFSEKITGGNPHYWQCCKLISISSSKFENHPSDWGAFIAVGVCGKFEILNCLFDHADFSSPTEYATMYLLFFVRFDKVDKIRFVGNNINSQLHFTARFRIDVFEEVGINNPIVDIEDILILFNSFSNFINYESFPNFVLQYSFIEYEYDFVLEKYVITNTTTLETNKYNHYFFENTNKSGSLTDRPTFIQEKPVVGYMYYDTTLTKPIYRSSNDTWVDNNGNIV